MSSGKKRRDTDSNTQTDLRGNRYGDRRASTPINIGQLERYLENHPDRSFVYYLIEGLRKGFHTGIDKTPTTAYECKNLLSARTQPKVTAQLIQSEFEKGFLNGPFKEIPYSIFRINPVGVAEGKYSKKKRLIVDLSAPHDNEDHESLNNLINKEEFSLKYVTIDQAIAIIKCNGEGSLLCKTDITDAFKIIPIHPSLWPFHGIKWDLQYYFYNKLVFGSRSSPKIFDTLSTAVCWIARHRFGIHNILHLLDDFLTVDPPYSNAEKTMTNLLDIFSRLGIPIASHKTVGPTTCLEYLGITLDTVNMEARLPSEKIDRIVALLNEFKAKKSCTKRELLSLLGHLNFACRVIYPGRSFISYLISLSTTVSELHHHIQLSEECRLDLDMWHKFLREWNGTAFFLNDDVSKAADMHLYTDATDKSFGGLFNNRWFQGYFPAEVFKWEATSMAFYELFPIVMACVLWGHYWPRKRILFHCDNLGTVEIINKGRSKVKSIMKLMRKLTWCAAYNNFTIHAQHIPGVSNSKADALSRFQMDKFRRLVPTADREPTECLTWAEITMV